MLKLKIKDLLINSPRWGGKPESGNRVGWVVKYKGLEYGDCVFITDDLVDDVILKECAEILNEQMNDNMKMVIGKDMGWKEFAQSYLLEFGEYHGIKILNE